MQVETIFPQLAVEALDERILSRFARLDEVQFHPRMLGPEVHRLRGELGAVIDRTPHSE